MAAAAVAAVAKMEEFSKKNLPSRMAGSFLCLGSVFDLDDHIDFHRDIERQRRHAEGGA